MRSDVTHGKQYSPVEASVAFLDSYLRSPRLSKQFTTEQMIKGKMNVVQEPDVRPESAPVEVEPWPPPSAGYVALSVDGTF